MTRQWPPVVALPCDPDADAEPSATLAAVQVEPTPELLATLRRIVSEHRVHAQHDGGDLHFVALERGIVRVRLSGACTHCHLAGQTLGALRRSVMQATGLPLRVAPALD